MTILVIDEERSRAAAALADRLAADGEGRPRILDSPPLRAPEGRSTPALVIATAIRALEPRLVSEHPEALIIAGSTGAALAASVAATKLGIPIVRLGAGSRAGPAGGPAGDSALVDRFADLLLCEDEGRLGLLRREGLAGAAQCVGDVAADPTAAAAAVRAWGRGRGIPPKLSPR